MRILQIAPATAEVSPSSTDPAAAGIYHLVEGLVARGHEVTLWAAPGSRSRADVRSLREPLRTDAGPAARGLYERLYAVAATAAADQFDLVHNHAGAAVEALLPEYRAVALSTLYTALPPRDRGKGMRGAYACLTWRQRAALSELQQTSCRGVVYPGLPGDELPFVGEEPSGGYLLYAAPIAPAFGLHEAIRIARRAEIPLYVAGAASTEQRGYWERWVAPQVVYGTVRHLGALPQTALAEVAARALGVLHPVQTDVLVDFGAVLALACGTPVLSYRRGAMAELVTHGETGFLVDEPWQFAGAIDSLDLIERRACRRRAEALFDARRMVDAYASIYEALLEGRAAPAALAQHPEFEALDPRPLVAAAD